MNKKEKLQAIGVIIIIAIMISLFSLYLYGEQKRYDEKKEIINQGFNLDWEIPENYTMIHPYTDERGRYFVEPLFITYRDNWYEFRVRLEHDEYQWLDKSMWLCFNSETGEMREI